MLVQFISLQLIISNMMKELSENIVEYGSKPNY